MCLLWLLNLLIFYFLVLDFSYPPVVDGVVETYDKRDEESDERDGHAYKNAVAELVRQLILEVNK